MSGFKQNCSDALDALQGQRKAKEEAERQTARQHSAKMDAEPSKREEELIKEFYARLEVLEDDTERKILLLDALRRAAEDAGIVPPILVGGGAVELYSMGGYASLDLDLTGDEKFIADFARRLGLENDPKYPNMFFSREKRLILDIRGKMDIDGAESRRKMLDMGESRIVAALSLEDIIVDRLVGCKWGGHEPSRQIAELLIRLHADTLDTTLLRQLAAHEDVAAEVNELLGNYPDVEKNIQTLIDG